ncbi:ribokinase [Pseudarthrobacter sp. J75]|uniref:ribokinase n=1 Tax=unclassified Pseudarthrobacter TaxID=2647000 RepID=UPI002E81A8FA|nr:MULTISPECIES: ribokinase [unclassified Pseudarthrobacter]MEE2524583.1 ribokinase [Pseudarthrobacter sp. J47]MEE2527588.1 ribokinase [Pseudarthrobacter sp. J75]
MTVQQGLGGKVAVVGSINLDQVIRIGRHPLPGETLLGSSLTLLPGGKGANQALAAARLGADVSLIGAIGNDANAALASELLQASGMDLSALRTADAPTGLAIICVAENGENTIVVIPGANSVMDAMAVESAAAQIAEAAVVVLQGEIPADGIAAAARLATGRVVLNLAPVVALDPAVIRSANPLVVNEHEGALVLSQLAPESAAPVDDEALVAALRAQGIPSVVLTRGADGAICSDDGGTQLLPAPSVQAVDTSGAGDAFVGALSTALAAGASLLDASRLAVRVGAFAVRGHGTQASYPSLGDLLPEVHA